MSNEDEKKIKSNLRKINNAMHSISDMGYGLYFDSGGLNVCDADTHDENCMANRDVVVIRLCIAGVKWDHGDW